jgi:diaminohydroxyphosphoribosylaminopyrimidine deaminase/5-amino-6-(5-phosphoribosylamino)uracil reductase
VITKSCDLPEDTNLWKITDNTKTLVVTVPDRNPELKQKLRDRDVEILELEDISPRIVMEELGKRGCNTVLWECGGRLSAEAIKAQMVQKVYAFIAPKLIGGFAAPSPIDDLGLDFMTNAINLFRPKFQQIGTDFLISGYLEP